MNIRESVPELELLNRTSMIHYQKQNANDQIANAVCTAAGEILNCVYDQFHHVDYAFGGKRSIGVTTQNQTYAALSMSSGEQRVFPGPTHYCLSKLQPFFRISSRKSVS